MNWQDAGSDPNSIFHAIIVAIGVLGTLGGLYFRKFIASFMQAPTPPAQLVLERATAADMQPIKIAAAAVVECVNLLKENNTILRSIDNQAQAIIGTMKREIEEQDKEDEIERRAQARAEEMERERRRNSRTPRRRPTTKP